MRKSFNRVMRSITMGAIASISIALVTTGCTEDIDKSDLYTFTGQTMTDYFEDNPEEFSSFLTIIGNVHTNKSSQSTIRDLLSARGNYTCFAPTNEAIKIHLDSLYRIGEIESTDITTLSDSIAESIVFNSIIDNGMEEAYHSTRFIEGAFTKTNMKDRYISINFGNDPQGKSTIYVNNDSKVLTKDIEVTNGYIHTIDRVISPSTSTISDLVIGTDNLSIFASFLKATGWNEKLTSYRDEKYEEFDMRGEQTTVIEDAGYYPEHRYLGYTIFVEPDSIYEQHGIHDIESLKKWLQDNNLYSDCKFDDDYRNEDNAVNQFVAYHLLPQILIWNKLVIFCNEKGFNNNTPNDGSQFATNVWEYYETMGKKRRLMKITGIRNGKMINRHAKMNVNTYAESYVDIPGIEIKQTNGKYDNNALNGYYYPIMDILTWNDEVKNVVLNERMRFDICSLLPELMSNNIRQNKAHNWNFPPGYFDNVVNVSNETLFRYQPNYENLGGTWGWINYQSDEFSIRGIYDFTMKLPPVPFSGTYELRYGISANGNRGMAQIYIGTNPSNLPPQGIPLDLRIEGRSTYLNWKADNDLGSDEEIDAHDKALRNLTYMKAPKYFYPTQGVCARDCQNALRRIIYTGQFSENETYYIRFKSVLNNRMSEFFYDYLELVPKSVYSGIEAEDKW